MKSIRSTLSRYLLTGASVLLLVTFVFQEHRLRTQLETDFDQSLRTKAKALITLTTQHSGVVELDFSDEIMPEFNASAQPEYFQLWLANGEVIERSRSLAGDDLPRKRRLALGEKKFTDVDLRDGRKGRMAQFKFIPHTKDNKTAAPGSEEADTSDNEQLSTPIQVHISLARERESLDESLESARLTLALTALLLVAGLFVLVRVAVAKGLAPLRAVSRQVRLLDAETLGGRIDAGQSVDELQPVVTQLNQLLARLETSFAREKRFSGNVAHELRTPLAEIRSIAEVGSRWPNDANLVKEFYADLLDVTEGMEHTVANLLTLARCDSGEVDVQIEPVVITELIEDVWSRSLAAEGDKSLLIDPALAGVIVQTDRTKTRMLVQNLLLNALTYSPADSEIRVMVAFNQGIIDIAFSNQSLHLEERDLEHLFERFWQKDPARTGGNRAGLGLALAKALADVLQLKLLPVLKHKVFTISVSGFVGVQAES